MAPPTTSDEKVSFFARQALSSEIQRGLDFLKYDSVEGMGRDWSLLVGQKLGKLQQLKGSPGQPPVSCGIENTGVLDEVISEDQHAELEQVVKSSTVKQQHPHGFGVEDLTVSSCSIETVVSVEHPATSGSDSEPRDSQVTIGKACASPVMSAPGGILGQHHRDNDVTDEAQLRVLDTKTSAFLASGRCECDFLQPAVDEGELRDRDSGGVSSHGAMHHSRSTTDHGRSPPLGFGFGHGHELRHLKSRNSFTRSRSSPVLFYKDMYNYTDYRSSSGGSSVEMDGLLQESQSSKSFGRKSSDREKRSRGSNSHNYHNFYDQHFHPAAPRSPNDSIADGGDVNLRDNGNASLSSGRLSPPSSSTSESSTGRSSALGGSSARDKPARPSSLMSNSEYRRSWWNSFKYDLGRDMRTKRPAEGGLVDRNAHRITSKVWSNCTTNLNSLSTSSSSSTSCASSSSICPVHHVWDGAGGTTSAVADFNNAATSGAKYGGRRTCSSVEDQDDSTHQSHQDQRLQPGPATFLREYPDAALGSSFLNSSLSFSLLDTAQARNATNSKGTRNKKMTTSRSWAHLHERGRRQSDNTSSASSCIHDPAIGGRGIHKNLGGDADQGVDVDEDQDQEVDDTSSLREYTFARCLSSRRRESSPPMRAELVRRVRSQQREIRHRDREIRRLECEWQRDVSRLRQQIGLIALQKCSQKLPLSSSKNKTPAPVVDVGGAVAVRNDQGFFTNINIESMSTEQGQRRGIQEQAPTSDMKTSASISNEGVASEPQYMKNLECSKQEVARVVLDDARSSPGTSSLQSDSTGTSLQELHASYYEQAAASLELDAKQGRTQGQAIPVENSKFNTEPGSISASSASLSVVSRRQTFSHSASSHLSLQDREPHGRQNGDTGRDALEYQIKQKLAPLPEAQQHDELGRQECLHVHFQAQQHQEEQHQYEEEFSFISGLSSVRDEIEEHQGETPLFTTVQAEELKTCRLDAERCDESNVDDPTTTTLREPPTSEQQHTEQRRAVVHSAGVESDEKRKQVGQASPLLNNVVRLNKRYLSSEESSSCLNNGASGGSRQTTTSSKKGQGEDSAICTSDESKNGSCKSAYMFSSKNDCSSIATTSKNSDYSPSIVTVKLPAGIDELTPTTVEQDPHLNTLGAGEGRVSTELQTLRRNEVPVQLRDPQATVSTQKSEPTLPPHHLAGGNEDLQRPSDHSSSSDIKMKQLLQLHPRSRGGAQPACFSSTSTLGTTSDGSSASVVQVVSADHSTSGSVSVVREHAGATPHPGAALKGAGGSLVVGFASTHPEPAAPRRQEHVDPARPPASSCATSSAVATVKEDESPSVVTTTVSVGSSGVSTLRVLGTSGPRDGELQSIRVGSAKSDYIARSGCVRKIISKSGGQCFVNAYASRKMASTSPVPSLEESLRRRQAEMHQEGNIGLQSSSRLPTRVAGSSASLPEGSEDDRARSTIPVPERSPHLSDMSMSRDNIVAQEQVEREDIATSNKKITGNAPIIMYAGHAINNYNNKDDSNQHEHEQKMNKKGALKGYITSASVVPLSESRSAPDVHGFGNASALSPIICHRTTLLEDSPQSKRGPVVGFLLDEETLRDEQEQDEQQIHSSCANYVAANNTAGGGGRITATTSNIKIKPTDNQQQDVDEPAIIVVEDDCIEDMKTEQDHVAATRHLKPHQNKRVECQLQKQAASSINKSLLNNTCSSSKSMLHDTDWKRHVHARERDLCLREAAVFAREEQVKDWEARLWLVQDELEKERHLARVREQKLQLEIEDIEQYRCEFEKLRTDLIHREAELGERVRRVAPAELEALLSCGTNGLPKLSNNKKLKESLFSEKNTSKVKRNKASERVVLSRNDEQVQVSEHGQDQEHLHLLQEKEFDDVEEMKYWDERDEVRAVSGSFHQQTVTKSDAASSKRTEQEPPRLSVVATADLERLDSRVRRFVRMLRWDCDAKMRGLQEENERLHNEVNILLGEKSAEKKLRTDDSIDALLKMEMDGRRYGEELGDRDMQSSENEDEASSSCSSVSSSDSGGQEVLNDNDNYKDQDDDQGRDVEHYDRLVHHDVEQLEERDATRSQIMMKASKSLHTAYSGERPPAGGNEQPSAATINTGKNSLDTGTSSTFTSREIKGNSKEERVAAVKNNSATSIRSDQVQEKSKLQHEEVTATFSRIMSVPSRRTPPGASSEDIRTATRVCSTSRSSAGGRGGGRGQAGASLEVGSSHNCSHRLKFKKHAQDPPLKQQHTTEAPKAQEELAVSDENYLCEINDEDGRAPLLNLEPFVLFKSQCQRAREHSRQLQQTHKAAGMQKLRQAINSTNARLKKGATTTQNLCAAASLPNYRTNQQEPAVVIKGKARPNKKTKQDNALDEPVKAIAISYGDQQKNGHVFKNSQEQVPFKSNGPAAEGEGEQQPEPAVLALQKQERPPVSSQAHVPSMSHTLTTTSAYGDGQQDDVKNSLCIQHDKISQTLVSAASTGPGPRRYLTASRASRMSSLRGSASASPGEADDTTVLYYEEQDESRLFPTDGVRQYVTRPLPGNATGVEQTTRRSRRLNTNSAMKNMVSGMLPRGSRMEQFFARDEDFQERDRLVEIEDSTSCRSCLDDINYHNSVQDDTLLHSYAATRQIPTLLGTRIESTPLPLEQPDRKSAPPRQRPDLPP
ncbi:unnamed protein product [Amoebophrya sp. A25]|nr:unnamed protein product [Amoebophrya sp. A25]|eukprot:GSA25T00012140001.1